MTDITELAQSKSLRKKLNRRLNDALGFQRTSGGKHTTISLSIDECKSVLAALDERFTLVESGEYGDAYQGAREDLAIWKRRALEAEESVRRLEQINDHLVKEAQGESRMGEPVIAQPAPVVMDDEKLRALFDAWFASDCSFDQSPEASEADNIAWRESYWYVWQRCRAAMLQAEPVTTANKLGSSPAQSPTDHGYRKGCECSGCKTTVRICAELAGWIPVSERIPGRYYVLAADFSGRYYPPSQPNTQVGIHDDWFGDGKPTWDDGDGNDLHLKQVTHWMPLPAAPLEVK
ncbi:DUF551 domain-containing protein [Klebsiella aerogenes]